MRVRYEVLAGQFRPGYDADDDLLSIKTTLFAEYDAGTIRFGGELGDSRVYGADAGSFVSSSEVNTFEPIQAYVAADFDRPFGHGTRASVQFGRMTLNIGSRRLVANDDYRNTGNGFTGARADVAAGKSSATLLYLLPQRRLPEAVPSILDNRHAWDRESWRLRLWGGFVGRTLGQFGALDATYLRLIERDRASQPTRDRRLNTFGARLFRNPQPATLDWDLEAMRQTGTISASAVSTARTIGVSAGFVHVEAGYTFASPWKPHVSLEYDWASGDAPGGRYGRFDTLYGMRRADFAPASIYGAFTRSNIITPGVRLEVVPSKGLDAFVAWRALWAEEPTDIFSTTGVRNATLGGRRYGGQQLEGRVRRWLLANQLRAEVNAVLLLREGLLREAPNLPSHGNTLYGSFALTGSF